MAIELTTVFKVGDIDPTNAFAFAEALEAALGDVLQEEKMAGITAYFVAAAESSASLRVGMRFEDMNEEYLPETASELLELAVKKIDKDGFGSVPSHHLKRLSSQLVSA